MQRFARAARTDLRRRLRRVVHRPRRGQRDLARGAGDASVRRCASAHAAVRRARPRRLRGRRGRACNQAESAQEPARIALLLDAILPGLRDLPSGLTPEEEVRAAVEANVRWSMRQVLETPEGEGPNGRRDDEARGCRLRAHERARAVPSQFIDSSIAASACRGTRPRLPCRRRAKKSQAMACPAMP